MSRFSERLVIPTFYAPKKLAIRKDIALHICWYKPCEIIVAEKRKYAHLPNIFQSACSNQYTNEICS